MVPLFSPFTHEALETRGERRAGAWVRGGLAALVLAISGGTAVLADCLTEPGESGRVVAVRDGDTLVLEGGLVVRLAGIEAPKRPPGGKAQPAAEKARAELDRIALGAGVALRYWGERRDRHGRAVAEAVLHDGASLGELMVAGGFARVRGRAEPLDCLGPLLSGEKAARAARSGLWPDPVFAIRNADDPSLRTQKGLYVLVQGRVASVGHGSRMVFLNFGQDWRRDFTVMLATEVATQAVGEGQKADWLAGKRVLVRGVVEEKDGALIRVNWAGGIEILNDD